MDFDFELARSTTIPFGKHKGRTLQDIREAGDLKYLDWLLGETWFFEKKDLSKSVRIFMRNPDVARELAQELEEEE